MGRHFPFAVRLLGTSSRSVPLTGEVRVNRGCPLHLVRRDGHPSQSYSECRVLGLKTRSAPWEKRVRITRSGEQTKKKEKKRTKQIRSSL